MSEIKRTGPPTARDVKGRMITWALPVNAMPDKEWRQFFVQTRDTTVVCSPHHVHMYQGMLVFESLEEDVATWIDFIDKWMADANKRHAEWEATQRARDDDVNTQARDRRIQDLNDKFRNL